MAKRIESSSRFEKAPHISERYDQKEREILELSEKWGGILNIGPIIVEHRFIKGWHKEDKDCLAQTDGIWHQHQASIKWFLGKLVGLDHELTEKTVVHEHAHILMASMESHVPDRYVEQSELAITMLTDVLLKMDRQGQETVPVPQAGCAAPGLAVVPEAPAG